MWQKTLVWVKALASALLGSLASLLTLLLVARLVDPVAHWLRSLTTSEWIALISLVFFGILGLIQTALAVTQHIQRRRKPQPGESLPPTPKPESETLPVQEPQPPATLTPLQIAILRVANKPGDCMRNLTTLGLYMQIDGAHILQPEQLRLLYLHEVKRLAAMDLMDVTGDHDEIFVTNYNGRDALASLPALRPDALQLLHWYDGMKRETASALRGRWIQIHYKDTADPFTGHVETVPPPPYRLVLSLSPVFRHLPPPPPDPFRMQGAWIRRWRLLE